jgi:hypothetical protein
MRITLHIGLPKTGTTAIQRTLERNFEKLAAQGCLFPKTPIGLWGGHHKVFLQVSPLICREDIRAICGLGNDADLLAQRARFPAELRKEIEHYQPDHLILSAEQLSMWMWKAEHVQDVKDFLTAYSDNIQILVYLREQSRMLASYYTQSVVSGHTKNFQMPFPNKGETITDAFERRLQEFYARNPSDVYGHDIFPFWLDYASLTDLWASVFGEEALKIRIFDKSRLVNGDAVQDFLVATGLESVGDLKILGEVHSSPSERGMKALRIYNAIVPMYRNGRLSPLRKLLTKGGVFRRIPGPPFRLDKSQETAVRDFFRTGNAEVSERFMKSKTPLFAE